MNTTDFHLMHELGLALLFTIGFGLVFLISELVYYRYKVNPEYTRKVVHIGCGTIAMFIAITHVHLYTIISLGILFTVLVWYMMKKNLLMSVHSVKRKTYGSVLFPAGVVACVIAGIPGGYKAAFFIPLATMIYSDTLAALIGVNFPLKQYKIAGYVKSIGGSIAFLLSAFIIYLTVMILFSGNSGNEFIIKAVLFALVTTIVEGISVKGWDDLTIPLASILFLETVMK